MQLPRVVRNQGWDSQRALVGTAWMPWSPLPPRLHFFGVARPMARLKDLPGASCSLGSEGEGQGFPWLGRTC